mmetsp:Transcript_48678/g.89777  ORF Transcript_48678/g.89777 Transcript_48678/m.89777 type:complete len:216 (+) Transcript_48678:32-679(+)
MALQPLKLAALQQRNACTLHASALGKILPLGRPWSNPAAPHTQAPSCRHFPETPEIGAARRHHTVPAAHLGAGRGQPLEERREDQSSPLWPGHIVSNQRSPQEMTLLVAGGRPVDTRDRSLQADFYIELGSPHSHRWLCRTLVRPPQPSTELRHHDCKTPPARPSPSTYPGWHQSPALLGVWLPASTAQLHRTVGGTPPSQNACRPASAALGWAA